MRPTRDWFTRRWMIGALAVVTIVVGVVLVSGMVTWDDKYRTAAGRYAVYAGHYGRAWDGPRGWTSCYGQRWDTYSEAVRLDLAEHRDDRAYKSARAAHYARLSREYANASRRPWRRLPDPPVVEPWLIARVEEMHRLEMEANLSDVAARQKWVEAMPRSLKSHWGFSQWDRMDAQPELPPLRRALEAGVPAKEDRILALLSWYGSGRGPWSGFPAYEAAAEQLLLDYTTGDLIAAIAGRELSEAQTEGAARLFGGWMFSQLRPDDLRLLPIELRVRLRRNTAGSADEDKRSRAQKAFGEE